MRYSLEVTTAPAAEPLTLTEAKAHLRVDVDDDDELINALIVAAREYVENYTRRSLVQRTLALHLDNFPGEIRLPRGPVSSISSITYKDQSGNTQTVSTSIYQTDLTSMPARICPVFGGIWPIPAFGTLNAVTVNYIAGYAPGNSSPTDYAEKVPVALQQAMKLMIGHWYENREAVDLARISALEVPMAAKSLMAVHEVRDFTLE